MNEPNLDDTRLFQYIMLEALLMLTPPSKHAIRLAADFVETGETISLAYRKDPRYKEY